MADFQTQVQGLVNKTLSGQELTDLNTYLSDGAIDVTQRTISLYPDEAFKFQRPSTEQTSNDISISGADVLSVLRESGTDGDWRACRQIPSEFASRAKDINSIHYASKFNPAYSLGDSGKVSVYPDPSAGGANSVIVNYINNAPVDATGGPLTYTDSNLAYFPSDRIYLIVIYSAIKILEASLQNELNQFPDALTDIVLEDISTDLPVYSGPGAYVAPTTPANPGATFDLNTIETFNSPTYTELSLPDIPDMNLPAWTPTGPSMSVNSTTITGTAPIYTQPVINFTSDITVDTLTISHIPPSVPSILGNTLNFNEAAPSYVEPLTSPDFGDADTWINTEEDSEMSNARVSVIQSQIQKYQADVQNQVQVFNKENAEYQIKFQEAVQKSQNSSTFDAQLIEKYKAELSDYVNKVNKDVQEYQANQTQKINLFQIQRTTEIQKYQADVQNSLNKFNEESTVYSSILQKDLQDAQLADSKQVRDIQTFQANVENYQAQVNKEVQRWVNEEYTKVFSEYQTKVNSRVQTYNADIQKETARVSASVNEYTNRLNKNLQEYQIEKGIDVSIYQTEITQANNKFQSDLTLSSTEFQNNLNKYTADTQNVTASNQNKIAKYSAELQNYQGEVIKCKTKSELIMQRYMNLQKQYNEAFLIAAPRQQGGKEDGR